MLRPTKIILALVLISASALAHQEDKEKSGGAARDKQTLEAQAAQVPQDQVRLLQEKGSWVLEIQSGGGFHGRGRGGLTVTSEGRLTSTMPEAACEVVLQPPVLETLARLARSARPFNNVELNASVCNDCYSTSMVLRRREADGSVRTYTAYWDDSTKKSIPSDVISIHDAILGARDCK